MRKPERDADKIIAEIKAKRQRAERTNDPPPDPPPHTEVPGPNGAASTPASGRRGKPYKGLITSKAFLADLKPPRFIIKGIIQEGFVATLCGNTGHGKTLIALLMAIKIALGDFFCGRLCKQGSVVFLAGENPENVRVQFFALCAELGVDGEALPILWHDGVFSFAQANERMRARSRPISRYAPGDHGLSTSLFRRRR